MHLKRRNTCRVCGSSALTPAISLGEQYLQGSFVKPGKEMPSTRKIPTSLVRCDPMKDENACGLLQMEYTIPPGLLYDAYWYRSGTNKTMRDHLKGIATEVCEMCKPSTKSMPIVLDIGCNDGTLLGYYPPSFTRVGIDPCDIAKEIKEPIHAIHDFFPSPELDKQLHGAQCDIITSIAMFYDLNDPRAFVREIKKVLAPEGLWCFEMSYMPNMLRKTSYDMICHEHIEYYSLAVIEYILGMEGMKVVRAGENSINGGSLRCYVTHFENCTDYSKFREELSAMRQAEFDLELDTDKPYKKFRDDVDKHKMVLNTLIRSLHVKGKKIHIYGASTKGNTILQWCGLDNSLIDYAAERNPDKYGAHTLGTNIPIISEAESRKMNPDYYLVLPWHFKEEFMERENEAFEQGTGFIFPLPEIDVIRKEMSNE